MSDSSDRKNVFLSYSKVDEEFVAVLCKALRARGHQVSYVPIEPRTATETLNLVNSKMAKAEVVVAVLSVDAVRSSYVTREVNAACNLALSGTHTVVRAHVQPCAVEPLWASTAAVNFYGVALEEAVDELNSVIGGSSPNRVSWRTKAARYWSYQWSRFGPVLLLIAGLAAVLLLRVSEHVALARLGAVFAGVAIILSPVAANLVFARIGRRRSAISRWLTGVAAILLTSTALSVTGNRVLRLPDGITPEPALERRLYEDLKVFHHRPPINYVSASDRRFLAGSSPEELWIVVPFRWVKLERRLWGSGHWLKRIYLGDLALKAAYTCDGPDLKLGAFELQDFSVSPGESALSYILASVEGAVMLRDQSVERKFVKPLSNSINRMSGQLCK